MSDNTSSANWNTEPGNILGSLRRLKDRSLSIAGLSQGINGHATFTAPPRPSPSLLVSELIDPESQVFCLSASGVYLPTTVERELQREFEAERVRRQYEFAWMRDEVMCKFGFGTLRGDDV